MPSFPAPFAARAGTRARIMLPGGAARKTVARRELRAAGVKCASQSGATSAQGGTGGQLPLGKKIRPACAEVSGDLERENHQMKPGEARDKYVTLNVLIISQKP